MLLADALAMGAALCFAVCSVVQQHEAAAIEQRGIRLLALLILRPWFIAGLLIEGAGLTLQAFALGAGTLVVVQPLLVTGLLFAVPLSTFIDRRSITAREIVGAVACVIGLVVFLATSRPAAGVTSIAPGRGLALGMPLIMVVLGAVILAQRRSAARGTLLALASGILFGLAGGLVKVTVRSLELHGPGALLTWPPYALVIIGFASFITSQNAFQAGELGPTLALLTVTEPIVAIIAGVYVLHETIANSPAAVATEIASALVSAVGVTLLSGSESVRRRGGVP